MEIVKLKLLMFGITREITGNSTMEIDIQKPATVLQLQEYLRERYPEMKKLPSLMIAVNQNYTTPDTLIGETDEVAIIPPVSGG